MAEVLDEFRTYLANLKRRHASNPGRELLELFLLALEREELVSIGYRESRIVARLDDMPIDDDVRSLIHHALVWIWKDEEMHSIYIRGAILRIGSARLRAQAFATQAAGGLAGWASSVLQHGRWTRTPISWTIANGVKLAGSVLGKIPTDVKKHLRYGPFRNFCLFNVDAEQTAWACWERIVELSRSVDEIGEELLGDFERVVSDEHRHEQVFRILAESIDDEDRLAPGTTVVDLVKRIGEVGEFFLPRRFRESQTVENPLGSGGRVHCVRGNCLDEKLQCFRGLLEDCELADALHQRAEFLETPLARLRVAIKPTFMLGYHRRDTSPITDPELIEELARFLRELGCADIALVEGRSIYDRFFHRRTVRDVAAYFGFESPRYRVVDTSEEQVPHQYSRGMAQYTISRTWKEADFRISFPRLRSHPIELALLSVGNVEWVGARCDEFLFLERQANRTTAVMMLLDDFPPHFALVDAYEQAPDGLVGVMGCPRPRRPLRLYAGADALAVDTVACRHVGVNNPRESSILRAACHWFGGWSEGIEVIGCDDPIDDWRGPYSNELRALLSFLAYPVYVLGSGRGALFVPEMDEETFPPLRGEGLLLRLGRRCVRRILGLRHPRRR